MFDISAETPLPINDVPDSLPTRPHISSVWRWIQRGIRGVRLETVMIGGQRFTSVEALRRFVEETTAAAAAGKAAGHNAKKRDRTRAIEAAERKLARR